jgi:hypothetical protein
MQDGAGEIIIVYGMLCALYDKRIWSCFNSDERLYERILSLTSLV